MKRLIISLVVAAVLCCIGCGLLLAQQPFFFPIPLQGGTSAQAGTIALDATTAAFQSAGSNISTQSTPTYTSTSSNDIIIAVAACAGSTTPPTVSSVTGGSLSWLMRSQNRYAANFTDTEVWYAQASGIFSSTVTVNWSGNCSDPTISVFGVVNVNAATPWDSNGSLPVKATASGPSPRTVGGVSTTAPTTMLLWVIASSTVIFLNNSPAIAGWTGIGATENVGGCCFGNVWSAAIKVTSPQSSASFTQTDTAANSGYAVTVDALLSQ